MGISANSLVLTTEGYKPASEIVAGDVCLTPLGESVVTGTDYVPADRWRPFHGTLKLSDRALIVGKSYVVTSALQWGVAMSDKSMILVKLGQPFMVEAFTRRVTDGVLSFAQRAEMISSPDIVDNHSLTTENGLMVVDSFVLYAPAITTDRLNIEHPVGIIQLPDQQQVETFKNAHF